MQRKLWISALVIIILLVPLAGYEFWYKPNYDGHIYYTYIDESYGNSYKEVVKRDILGNDFRVYYYKQNGYDKAGQHKLLKFGSSLGRPIKPRNYLKLTYNQKKHEITSWKKVSKSSIPKKALEQILK